MKYSRYCRSLLSTPATSEHRYATSHRSGADVAMVDLEDSVPPQRKEEGRRRAAGFFSAPSAASIRCAVRINAVTEVDGMRDLLAVREYPVRPAVVLIPKVESARDVEIVEQVLGPVCPDTVLFAVVETPRGLQNAPTIATSSNRLRALIFGAADYAFSVGARLTWEALSFARATVVNSARGAGIEVLDSPLFEAFDDDRLREEAALARDFGFSGKIAIHPRQVPVVNTVFSPDDQMLETARKVVAAGLQSGRGAAVVDGVVVGMPFFEASQRLIEEFGQRPAVDPARPADARLVPRQPRDPERER